MQLTFRSIPVLLSKRKQILIGVDVLTKPISWRGTLSQYAGRLQGRVSVNVFFYQKEIGSLGLNWEFGLGQRISIFHRKPLILIFKAKKALKINLSALKNGAEGRTWTGTDVIHYPLKIACLPSSTTSALFEALFSLTWILRRRLLFNWSFSVLHDRAVPLMAGVIGQPQWCDHK